MQKFILTFGEQIKPKWTKNKDNFAQDRKAVHHEMNSIIYND